MLRCAEEEDVSVLYLISSTREQRSVRIAVGFSSRARIPDDPNRTSPTGYGKRGTGIGDAQSWSVIVRLFKQHVDHEKRDGCLNGTLDVQLREITRTLFQVFSLLRLRRSIIQLLGSSSESH